MTFQVTSWHVDFFLEASFQGQVTEPQDWPTGRSHGGLSDAAGQARTPLGPQELGAGKQHIRSRADVIRRVLSSPLCPPHLGMFLRAYLSTRPLLSLHLGS